MDTTDPQRQDDSATVETTEHLTLDAVGSKPSSPLRPDFPLPTELKDMIYGYLLHHEHTKAAPYAAEDRSRTSRNLNTSHTFRYHPSILATNRRIKHGASKVLASNHLVVVSYECDGLDQAKHAHDLPIICEDQGAVAKFNGHVLRVHIRHWSKERHRHGIRCFLMLASDLPRFCGELMQWGLLNTSTLGKFLVKSQGSLQPHRLRALA